MTNSSSQRFSSVSAIDWGASRKSAGAPRIRSACCAHESPCARPRGGDRQRGTYAAPDRGRVQPGIRDVAALAEVIDAAAVAGSDIGSPEVLSTTRPGDRPSSEMLRWPPMDLPGCSAIRWAWSAWGCSLGLLAMDLLPAAKHPLARAAMGLMGRQPRLARGCRLAEWDFDVAVVGGVWSGRTGQGTGPGGVFRGVDRGGRADAGLADRQP